MSKQDLIKVVQRSISDAAFRRQLTTDANSALRGYSLTPEEIGALRSRDAGKLSAFGVDTRMSKVFTIDQGALGNATITSGSEPRDVAPAWIGDSQARGAVRSRATPTRRGSATATTRTARPDRKARSTRSNPLAKASDEWAALRGRSFHPLRNHDHSTHDTGVDEAGSVTVEHSDPENQGGETNVEAGSDQGGAASHQ